MLMMRLFTLTSVTCEDQSNTDIYKNLYNFELQTLKLKSLCLQRGVCCSFGKLIFYVALL